jgi:hypothetical protein
VEAHRVVRRPDSHIFYTLGSQMAVRLSALRARRPLPPGRFLVLISARDYRPQGHNAAGSIRSIELIHLIWTRTRDLPASSVVPQPTTLPRTPSLSCIGAKAAILHLFLKNKFITGFTRRPVRNAHWLSWGWSHLNLKYEVRIAFISGLCRLVCCLFNVAVGSSDYTVKRRMTG